MLWRDDDTGERSTCETASLLNDVLEDISYWSPSYERIFLENRRYGWGAHYEEAGVIDIGEVKVIRNWDSGTDHHSDISHTQTTMAHEYGHSIFYHLIKGEFSSYDDFSLIAKKRRQSMFSLYEVMSEVRRAYERGVPNEELIEEFQKFELYSEEIDKHELALERSLYILRDDAVIGAFHEFFADVVSYLWKEDP